MPAAAAAGGGKGGPGKGGDKREYVPIKPEWKGKTICKKSIIGKCDLGEECKDFHPNDHLPNGKIRICSFYQDANRGCKNGANCKDAHVGLGPEAAKFLISNRIASRSPSRAPKGGKDEGSKVCRSWRQRGTCPRGADCKFEHPEDMKGKPE